jgi:NADH:ubiquinone oxidoreductase subunit 5 (subunit L)/multisubunit Na+/H+ antiporter MnhA subunit
MPKTAITMLIGVLAIAGFPYFSGFYSKDAIIAQVLAYGESNPAHAFILLLPGLSAGITSFYMFRLWFMTFTGKPRDHHVYDHAHESPPIMWVPLAILAFFAIFAAGLPFWHVLENFIAYGQPAAANAGSVAGLQARSHELHGLATLIASATAGLGFSLALGMYFFGVLNPEDGKRQFPKVYDLLANKWYFDELYRYLLVRPTFVVSKVCAWFDKKVIDGLIDGSARETLRLSRFDGRFDQGIVDGLVNLIARTVFGGGVSLHRLQTGWLRGYVMYIAVGAVGIFTLGAFLFS